MVHVRSVAAGQPCSALFCQTAKDKEQSPTQMFSMRQPPSWVREQSREGQWLQTSAGVKQRVPG